MSDVVEASVLVGASLTTGLSAGLFAAFSYAVMPGLKQADDWVLVSAMHRINVAILNPLFLVVFLGPVVLTAVSVALAFGDDPRPHLPWLIAGLVLFTGMLAVTFAINVPLNNALDAAARSSSSQPSERDIADARQHFEARWTVWNVARAVLSSAAFGCLAWSLVQFGRATS